MGHRLSATALACALLGAAAGLAGQAGQPGQAGPPAANGQQGRGRGGAGQTAPARDTSQQPQQLAAPAGSGRISGRVITADSGSPVRGARVSLSAPQAPARSLVTDASGLFSFTTLPEGRYTLSVAKTGFITLSYGQRRPLQPGTPLQLNDGQRLEGIEMRLPRGSAITGRIVDENSDPLPNTVVRVMRYQYQQGERRLTPAGNAQTDDRGVYRVWGLNPGDYYVSAVMPNLGGLLNQLAGGGRGGGPGRGGPGPNGPPNGPGGGRGFGAGGPGAPIGALVQGALADPSLSDALAVAGLGNVASLLGGPSDGSDGVAYAPTYFPGVSSPSEARAVTVGLGTEALDIDFALLLVRTATISGRVTNPDGTPAVNGNVTLAPDNGASAGGGGRGGVFGETYAGRVQTDGGFSIANVPPGRYVLRARSNPGGQGPGGRGGRGGGRGGPQGPSTAQGSTDPVLPQFASQPLVVGGDITDLAVALMPGATISGTVSLPATTASGTGNQSQVRVMAQATDSGLGTNISAQVDANGRFTLQGVPAGSHWIRAQAPRGMTLKSAVVGGRDVIDEPYDVRGGESVEGLALTFTDRISEVNGTLTDDRGTPLTDFTVLAFSQDARLWRPQSRQIQTSRPDQNGKFQLRGLPAGRYYVTAVDPAVAGEWFEPAFLEEHRAGAVSLSLGEGETRTQDIRVR